VPMALLTCTHFPTKLHDIRDKNPLNGFTHFANLGFLI
jgi:hypothetical protein